MTTFEELRAADKNRPTRDIEQQLTREDLIKQLRWASSPEEIKEVLLDMFEQGVL